MLPAALVVVVYVASQEPEARGATTRALRTALGADATIVLREAPPTGDDDVARAADGAKAQAAAVVVWNADTRRVSIHLLRVAAKRWLDREIQFVPADLPEERGRTTGFAIASMLPEEDVEAARTPPPPPPPPPDTRPSLPEPRPVGPLRPTRYTFDLGATGALGIGGPATGVGVAAAFAWAPGGDGFGAFAAVTGRFGEVAAAQSSSRAFGLALGPQYARSLGPRARVSLGARAGIGLFYDQLHHYSGDEPEPVTEGHLLPGGRADAVAGLRFAENAGLFMTLGTEVVFGKTTVYVQGAEAATLPPLRLTTALGLRLGF